MSPTPIRFSINFPSIHRKFERVLSQLAYLHFSILFFVLLLLYHYLLLCLLWALPVQMHLNMEIELNSIGIRIFRLVCQINTHPLSHCWLSSLWMGAKQWHCIYENTCMKALNESSCWNAKINLINISTRLFSPTCHVEQSNHASFVTFQYHNIGGRLKSGIARKGAEKVPKTRNLFQQIRETSCL